MSVAPSTTAEHVRVPQGLFDAADLHLTGLLASLDRFVADPPRTATRIDQTAAALSVTLRQTRLHLSEIFPGIDNPSDVAERP
jgi:hypothetical protein